MDRVVVSTDSDEIAAVAREFGSEVVERPGRLSHGDKPDQALQHTLDTLLATEGYEPKIVLRLQPTSPLRTTPAIEWGVQELVSGNQAIIAICEPNRHPYLFVKQKRSRLEVHKKLQQPRQLYPKQFAISGAFYGAWRKYWEKHSFYGPEVRGILLPRWMSIDIDDDLDMIFADALLRQLDAKVAS